jgi:hypothetical protein
MHSASVQAGQKLNSSAWNVYEKHAGDAPLVKHALAWSKKSLELCETSPDIWPALADTYAHLLFVSGAKDDAVKMEQQALDKLKASGSSEVGQYEEALEKMKKGAL